MPSSLSPNRKKPPSVAISHAFPAQTKLFDLQHTPSRIYLLRSGQVQLARGHKTIVDYVGPGEFFGKQCLLGPRYRDQIATCLSPVKAQALSADSRYFSSASRESRACRVEPVWRYLRLVHSIVASSRFSRPPHNGMRTVEIMREQIGFDSRSSVQVASSHSGEPGLPA